MSNPGITISGSRRINTFFSGITKQECIETGLLNLLHYKELELSGAYGTAPGHMERALPFMQEKFREIGMLVEEVVNPREAPDLMPRVLSGNFLKYILDFENAAG